MDSETYQRAMGGTERMRLWFPNINVVMTARIKGSITEPDLQEAIRKARQMHPLLGARVQLDDEGYGIFSTEDVPPNELRFITRNNEDDWETAVKSELRHSWPIGLGPLARFTLLHTETESDLVVNAHHSICDARSLVYLIRDIVSFIAEPEQQIQPIVPISLAESLPSSAAGGFLYGLVTRYMNRKWLKKGIDFDERDYQKLHQTFWQDHEAKLFPWSLTAEETAVLVQSCREKEVSVNSAVYTAFLAAQDQCQDTSPEYFSNVMVPVDFRNYLTKEIGEALGFYASAVKMSFRYDPTISFWENARAFDQQVKKQLTEKNIFASQRSSAIDPTLMDGVVQAMFGDFDDEMAQKLAERMRDEARTGILVSNLGRLDIPREYDHLQLVWIKPPAVFAGNAQKAVEILTFNGRMHFTMTYGAMAIADETVEKVRDEVMVNLAHLGFFVNDQDN